MITEGIIEGRYRDRVFINGHELSPKRSQSIRNHSPDGFLWGYGGSGPAQLALSLLLELTDDERFALEHYQSFKWDIIAKIPQGSEFIMTVERVWEWIHENTEWVNWGLSV